MASFTVYAGDTWTWETTLTDSAGNSITAIDDAWFSIYSDKTTEIVSYTLTDAEMTLSSNTLTVTVAPVTTTAIAGGTYYLDVKVDVTNGATVTVTPRDTVVVKNESPLYDNY